MKAKIVSLTKPIGELEHLSPEELIVYLARVSSPNNQLNTATGHRLLSYCLKNGHWSVFDTVDVTMEIETSRAVMAQILRHSSFRFQELSQRYSVVDGITYDHVEARLKHVGGNRQGSGEVDAQSTIYMRLRCEIAADSYKRLLDAEIAPESARMLLPLATMTKAYMKGSVRSWITYFWQRLSAHAQKEHRELAQIMFDEFEQHFPVCAKLTSSGKMVYVEE
jgi:thymidylate synthase (FAD)